MNTYLGKLNVIRYDVYNQYRHNDSGALLAGCDIALAVVEAVDQTFQNNNLDLIPNDFLKPKCVVEEGLMKHEIAIAGYPDQIRSSEGNNHLISSIYYAYSIEGTVERIVQGQAGHAVVACQASSIDTS